MSINRITISSDCYLLFAELLYYCENTKQNHEQLSTKLPSLAEKVKAKEVTGDRDYYKVLSGKYHKPKTKHNTIHGTIVTKIKRDGERILFINLNSSITDFFEAIEQTYPNETKNGLRHFFETTLSFYFPIEAGKQVESTNEEAIAPLMGDFNNTVWYLYYHEYLDKPKTPYTLISRLILEIKDNKNITLYEKRENEDFIGEASLLNDTNSSILIIQLQRQSTSFKKKLELRIIQSGGITSNSVYMGQYMDTETGDKIVSGTFILENVLGHSLDERAHNPYLLESKHNAVRRISITPDKVLKTIQTSLIYNSGWERYIPKDIAKYLSHKWKNHSKSKPIATTLVELGNWLREQKEHKPYDEYKFNTAIEYDLFIVTPVGNINEIATMEYYQQINKYFFKNQNPSATEDKDKRNPIYDSSDDLKANGINKIYYSPRVKLHSNSKVTAEEPHIIIDNDMKAMRKSRFVIFIVPELVHTSALIKIGWAMQQEKPIFIFPLKKNVLPLLLQQPYDKKIFVCDPVSIKEIPSKLLAKYKKDLKW